MSCAVSFQCMLGVSMKVWTKNILYRFIGGQTHLWHLLACQHGFGPQWIHIIRTLFIPPHRLQACTQKLTEHGQFCMLHNELPAKSPAEFKGTTLLSNAKVDHFFFEVHEWFPIAMIPYTSPLLQFLFTLRSSSFFWKFWRVCYTHTVILNHACGMNCLWTLAICVFASSGGFMFLSFKVTESSHAWSILIRYFQKTPRYVALLWAFPNSTDNFSIGSNWEVSHPIINFNEAHWLPSQISESELRCKSCRRPKWRSH